MLVHVMSAVKQLFKVIETNRQRNRQADSRPQGVTSSDPIPETEHIFLVNTEFLDFLIVCRQCHEMLGNSGVLKLRTTFESIN